MIIEGVTEGLWSFQDPVEGKQYVERYLKEKYATVTANFDENGKLKSISTGDTERRTRRRASLDLPVVPTGEVIGKVFLVNGDSQTGASNAQLQLIDASGKVVQEVTSSFGGFYQFAKVPLGQYTLRVSPEQAQRLKLKPPPEQNVILDENKPSLSGMDITIETAPKVEIESHAITPLESQQLASSKPKLPSIKAKPIPHKKQNFPQKKLNTPLLSPSEIRQTGKSWGNYLYQRRTR